MLFNKLFRVGGSFFVSGFLPPMMFPPMMPPMWPHPPQPHPPQPQAPQRPEGKEVDDEVVSELTGLAFWFDQPQVQPSRLKLELNSKPKNRWPVPRRQILLLALLLLPLLLLVLLRPLAHGSSSPGQGEASLVPSPSPLPHLASCLPQRLELDLSVR